MSLALRSFKSISSNLGAKVLSGLVQFVAFIFLARWVSIETFGVYTFALAIIALSVSFVEFGISGAFLYFSAENNVNKNEAAAVHFTFRVTLLFIWTILAVVGTFLFAEEKLQVFLYALIPITILSQLSTTHHAVLLQRVTTERSAILQVIASLVMLPFSLFFAFQGFSILALLTINATKAVVDFLGLFFF